MEKIEQAIALVPQVKAVSDDVLARHIGRDDIVQATLLSLVSGRPAFFLGTPGVGKTDTAEYLASRIDGAVFYEALMPTIVSVEQLMVESTSIEEVSLDENGKPLKFVVGQPALIPMSRMIRTRDQLGRAAGAHIVFADEIWKAEPRVLQTLIDLSKGSGVRHEGTMVKTPLLAFLSASNELPDPEGNLGAIWSRMTIRVVVDALDRAGKTQLVKARLTRDRAAHAVIGAKLTLADVEMLRSARPHVEVSDAIVGIVLDVYQELLDDSFEGFSWAWQDDRRFGRVFDVMQARALLDGRSQVGKQDLAVLEWLLWDEPEQIATVKSKTAPYCRTPLMDAQELVDALLSPAGTVAIVRGGDRGKGVQAITQCEACLGELKHLESEARDDTAISSAIVDLVKQVNAAKDDVIAVVTGTGTRR